MHRVVYLHGFASGPASQKASFFRARIPQLEVPDLAGGDFEHLTITGQLRVIEALAAGDPVTLIGSSLGGYLAALYAARHPEVTRLVLLAPALGFARRWAHSINVEEWRRSGFIEVYHYGEKRQRKLGAQLLEDAASYEDSPRSPSQRCYSTARAIRSCPATVQSSLRRLIRTSDCACSTPATS